MKVQNVGMTNYSKQPNFTAEIPNMYEAIQRVSGDYAAALKFKYGLTDRQLEAAAETVATYFPQHDILKGIFKIDTNKAGSHPIHQVGVSIHS